MKNFGITTHEPCISVLVLTVLIRSFTYSTILQNNTEQSINLVELLR